MNNYNITNIKDLPQLEQILDGNFLVVENATGTNKLDFGDFVYNWLKTNNVITPTKKDVQDALIHAERRYREQRMSEHNGLGLAKALEPKSEEYRKKKLAREYIIIQLFETKELSDLIKLIKVDQFKK